MFRGFELKMASDCSFSCYDCDELYKQEGWYLSSAFQGDIRKRLQKVAEGSALSIKGNEIEDTWFPKVHGHFHMFLSHSHADEDLARAIAGLLKRKMNLDVFIDSLVWGFKDDLIRNFFKSVTPSWDNLVSICSHVDCMLTKSLIEMMDSCECLLFLNTPKSVSIKDAVKQTYSPWIYAELEASRFLRKHQDVARRGRLMQENFCRREKEASAQFKVSYQIPNHLTELSIDSFSNWMTRSRDRKGFDALDTLYEMYPSTTEGVYCNCLEPHRTEFTP